MNTPNLSEQISSSAADYRGLLDKLDHIADLLQSSAQDWDGQRVMGLLSERDKLCVRLVKPRERLRSLLEEVRDSGSVDVRTIDSLVHWLEAREGQMLQKQRDCESALASELEACKTDLVSFSRRSSVKAAYGKPTGTPNACFIDNKL